MRTDQKYFLWRKPTWEYFSEKIFVYIKNSQIGTYPSYWSSYHFLLSPACADLSIYRTSTPELRTSCHHVGWRFKGTRRHACTEESPMLRDANWKFRLHTRPRVIDPLAVVSDGNGLPTSPFVRRIARSFTRYYSDGYMRTRTYYTCPQYIVSLPVSPPSRKTPTSHEENMLPLRRKTIRTWTRYGMHRARSKFCANAPWFACTTLIGGQ